MESSVEVESIYKPIHQKEGSEILLMDKLEEKDRQEEGGQPHERPEWKQKVTKG